MFVVASGVSIPEEYFDAFISTCFKQLRKVPGAALRTKMSLFMSFLETLAKTGIYDFSKKMELWKNYADLIEKF